MYKCLWSIRIKGIKHVEFDTISISEFKNNFETVSEERFEVDYSVFVSMIEKVEYLRRDNWAIEENECLKNAPQGEESLKATNEMEDSVPG